MTPRTQLNRITRARPAMKDWPVRFFFACASVVPFMQTDIWVYNVGDIPQQAVAGFCFIWAGVGLILRREQQGHYSKWSYYLYGTGLLLASTAVFFIQRHNYFPLPGILGLLWASDAAISIHQFFHHLCDAMRRCPSSNVRN